MGSDTFLQGLAARVGVPTASPVGLAMAKPSPAPEDGRGGGEYMRFAEAAKFARVSEPTLRSWGRRGLRILRPSRGVVLIRKSDLIAFIEGTGDSQ